MAHRASVPAVLTMLLAAACAGPPVDPGSGDEIFFPQHGESGSGPAALLAGTLRLANGCLIIEADDSGVRNLVLWPSDWTIESSTDGIRVEDELAGHGARPDEHVTVGGGETDLSAAEEDIGEAIPERCNSDVYWFMTDMVEPVD